MLNRMRIPGFLFALVFLFLPGLVYAEALIHHEIRVVFSPDAHRLQVVDQISLPPSVRPDETGQFHFLLHAGLNPHSLTQGVTIQEVPQIPKQGMTPSETPDLERPLLSVSVPMTRYAITLPIGLRQVILSYEGEIHHPLTAEKLVSAGEQETPGLISAEGIFLSGESLWYPYFYNALMTFSLEILLPHPWNAVSQGERTENQTEGKMRRVRWESPEPQEEIFIVGGEWTEYQRQAGRVLTMAFLKTPDRGLAQRYLEATEQYLEMYQKLLGPYPYTKFALVENFWETGYGMPSFTLLGSKVLRLPFILNTSYPHEILHNWWGNGVYVDRTQGNWSEGLTTYLADFLLQEQKGMGKEARLAYLQKYANSVSKDQDFPLSEFQSRTDAASQAIGYGKTMFLMHMFRQSLGDEIFIKALRTFFHENRFKQASFETLSQAFSRAAQKEIGPEFMQWVQRKGAPRIRAKNIYSEKTAQGYLLSATLVQQQWGPAWSVTIPIAITLHGKKEAFQTKIFMDEKELQVSLVLPSRPIRLKIDPEYDLFRRLHPTEIPPSLRKAMNAESTLILLPATASVSLRREYQKFARFMKKDDPDQIEIAWDNEYETLPKDRSVWLMGWENRFQKTILKQLRRFGVSTNSAMTRIGKTQIPRRGHSLVLTAHHPKRSNLSLTWIASDHAASLPILARKLPHYGAYGYLAFRGPEVKNVEKGRWPPVGSPMSIRIKQGDGKWIKEKPATLVARKALTSTSPLFSEERMRQDIAFLSGTQLKGRGFGTPELDRAAEYIAAEFRKAGLRPADDAGRSFLQQWENTNGGVGSSLALKNVVGILPGSTPGLANEYIVIGAHYDHLGFGWPRVHEGDESKLHPGANGNASGVALLLELARLLKEDKSLKRSILFVAFTAKEVGLRGSEHMVSDQKSMPMGRITGMLNLDTVGQLKNNRLYVLGAGSSREWPPILRRAGFDTGIQVTSFPETFGSSDHLSFIKAAIPAIQFFTGEAPEIDRPSDTLDKIDLPGMVSVGRVVKEVLAHLANRPFALSHIPSQKETPGLIWERRTQRDP